MQPAAAPVWMNRWERFGLISFLIAVLGFGVWVEVRSAFLSRHMGDLGVFLRAAWAVRSGNDIYAVTDNSWHYSYPPLLAILMVPLADPPPGGDTVGMTPYAVSVAIWYAFSIICLFLAAHSLASAIEATSSDQEVRKQPARCARWWRLRLWPILVCLVPVGHSLMRGQVNLLLLALLCASAAAVIRGRHFRAGLWLAGAICLKIFPAFLVVYPLWRRDYRALAGCAVGLAVGLFLIPGAVFGPRQTLKYYNELADVLVRPALGAGHHESRAKELIDVTATDSQSLLAAMHNTLHLDRATRPRQASLLLRLVSVAIGCTLTLLALLAAGWHRPRQGIDEVLLFGTLTLNMLLLSPVCHLHYFCLSIPLVMALLARHWETAGSGILGLGLALLFCANVAANAIGQIPGQEVLRDCGLAMYGSLLLWIVGVVILWKGDRSRKSETGEGAHPIGMAA